MLAASIYSPRWNARPRNDRDSRTETPERRSLVNLDLPSRRMTSVADNFSKLN